jgi:hypothetical protein
MHLLLGDSTDVCCTAVLRRMESLGLRARVVDVPLAPPTQLTWRLDDEGLRSCYSSPHFSDSEEIESVLVRNVGLVDPIGWNPTDHAYMQAEVQATLLAWLHGLKCPVINRPSAALWYRNKIPLLTWHSLLRRCGIPCLETIITNDPEKARQFAHSVSSNGVVLTPLTGEGNYLVVTEEDWRGVAAIQKLAPVCLSEPHERTHSAVIVGDRVIWNSGNKIEMTDIDAALLRLASEARLEFLEVAVAMVRGRPAITKVDALPELAHFSASSGALIIDALVADLTRRAVRILAQAS